MNALTRLDPAAEPAAATGLDCPQHDARDLTGHGAHAVIMLDGTAYFLRITRAGKLILTK